jgi:sulfoxide reductase heme-binding subunit YedZ
MYAAVHFILFAVRRLAVRSHRAGVLAEVLSAGLCPIVGALAATSFRWAMRRMGKNWKRLHRYIYLGAILVVLHLALVIKGDFFRLGGDVWKPILATIVIGGLLIVRIPRIRRALLSFKHLGAHAKPRSTIPPASSKLAED